MTVVDGVADGNQATSVRGVELFMSSPHRTEVLVSHANARLTVHARLELVRRVVQDGRPVAHVAAELNCSRATGYKWLRRWREQGPTGLVDRPSIAHRLPRKTPAALEARIIELRHTRKLGPARIAPLVGVAASTVHAVLTRHRLHRLAWLDRPTGQLVRRYERAAPGELIHIDVKKLGGCAMVVAGAYTAVTATSSAEHPACPVRLRLHPLRGR